MKNISLYILLTFALTIWSCNDDLAELNVNPDIVVEPNMDFLLTHSEILLLEQRYFSNFGYAAFSNIFSKYGSDFESRLLGNKNVVEYFFSQHYQGALKNIDAQLFNSSTPELTNYHSMALLMKVYVVQRLTDIYGDIPYIQAGLGYEELLLEPKYDTQKDIYFDLLKQCETAVNGFDEIQRKPSSADIVYQGDLNKWRKFGHSLMLKLAMRMSEVEPEMARTYAQQAIQKGVMDNFEDSFVVQYLPDTDYSTTANGNAKGILNYPTRKLSEFFIQQLQSTNDPRSPFYAVLPNGEDRIESQKGLPYFTTAADINLNEYSMSNPASFASYGSAYIHMSHAQIEYLTAEAIERGWVSGDAGEHLKTGILSSMSLLNHLFPEVTPISESEMEAYVQRINYAPSNFDEALSIISTQYWIDTYFNFNETYSNWRRTDYPEILNHNIKIPLRMTYPSVEYATNEDNVMEAVQRMGEDSFFHRVWWDIK